MSPRFSTLIAFRVHSEKLARERKCEGQAGQRVSGMNEPIEVLSGQTISSSEIINDLLRQVEDALSKNANLQETNAYRSYAAEIKIEIQLNDVDVQHMDEENHHRYCLEILDALRFLSKSKFQKPPHVKCVSAADCRRRNIWNVPLTAPFRHRR